MKLTQAKAAAILGIDQPKVFNLLRGPLDEVLKDDEVKLANLPKAPLAPRVSPTVKAILANLSSTLLSVSEGERSLGRW